MIRRCDIPSWVLYHQILPFSVFAIAFKIISTVVEAMVYLATPSYSEVN